MVYRGMYTNRRSKKYTYVQCRGKVTKTAAERFFFFFLVQWQLSYKETVKHVPFWVWNMPRITTQ